MYSNILVPVDNSRHSNRAIDTGIELGKRFGAKLVGCHVYAAKMHDYRFKQMEFTLPEEYLVEQELHRQRKIHDSLITMGLELISDCYLESMKAQCEGEGVAFEGKMMDGKHNTELVRDIRESGYDLVVLGVLGIGRTRDSQVGSVCARVAQESSRDVWVVKHLPEAGEPERDTVLVGVDGSPKSFGALATAIELCQRFDKKLEVIAVYDPYLHYAVFKGVVEVLTEKASKVFRFEEQNQLHEEIIDTGLAAIYQSHLNVAEQMAREVGVECSKTLLDGKCFQKVLDHARKSKPWVLVVGRLGVHSPADATGLGSNTENLLRLAPCDVLLTTAEVTPELDVRAEESIHWTPEALSRMERVPPAVLGIARTAILRLALEQGHSVVSSDLVTEAMERFMPKRAAERNMKLAEALVLDRAERGETVMVCQACGIAARTAQAVKCQVCGGEVFEALDPQAIARIIMEEGGAEEETTYDGRKVRWTQEAKEALRAIDDRYQRRRAKARIEKAAHGGRTDLVTLELAKRFIEEETGILFAAPAKANGAVVNGAAANGNAANGNGHASGAAANGHESDLHATNGQAANAHGASENATNGHVVEADAPRLVARDGKGVPLVSTREWTTPAIERIVRVPAGYMRDRTQERVEALAAAAGATTIDLPMVEQGIELGVRAMEEMIVQQAAVPAAAAVGETAPQAAASACPFARVAAAQPEALRSLFPLDEVSVVSELERQRRELGTQG
ncbi:MAG TPA: universal stress protein [Thermoanaerobaculia bacterium]|jgi:nucleotide-binding universal stress UspA family protein|nr:universal stress protein [Thermoanaerobaculia bacterium]